MQFPCIPPGAPPGPPKASAGRGPPRKEAGGLPQEPPALLPPSPSLPSPSPKEEALQQRAPQNRCVWRVFTLSPGAARGSGGEQMGRREEAAMGSGRAEGPRATQAAAPGRQAGANPSGTSAPGAAPGRGERLGRERPALRKDVLGKHPTPAPPGGVTGQEPREQSAAPRPTSRPQRPPDPWGTCESPHRRRPRLAVDHRPHDEDGEAGHGAEAGVGGAEAELPARRGHGLRAPGARASSACGESQVQGPEPEPEPPAAASSAQARPRPRPSPRRRGTAPPAGRRPPEPEPRPAELGA